MLTGRLLGFGFVSGWRIHWIGKPDGVITEVIQMMLLVSCQKEVKNLLPRLPDGLGHREKTAGQS
jgi:hypothetical protein